MSIQGHDDHMRCFVDDVVVYCVCTAGGAAGFSETTSISPKRSEAKMLEMFSVYQLIHAVTPAVSSALVGEHKHPFVNIYFLESTVYMM